MPDSSDTEEVSFDSRLTDKSIGHDREIVLHIPDWMLTAILVSNYTAFQFLEDGYCAIKSDDFPDERDGCIKLVAYP